MAEILDRDTAPFDNRVSFTEATISGIAARFVTISGDNKILPTHVENQTFKTTRYKC